MKKIILTQRLVENDSYKETRETLDIQYAKLIKEAGFLPIVLPYEVDFRDYFFEIDIDGIILTGGNDLNSLNPNALSEQRDEYENSLIKYGVDNHIPILGICRGLQVIAAYFGSTFKKVTDHVAVYHKLNVNKNSKYADSLTQLSEVNSFHNFAVEKLGNDLICSATSYDGTIEAMEHEKYKIFAQMWHSERENSFEKNEVALIHEFFNGKHI